jgi:AraC-like DNA-binding protein
MENFPTSMKVPISTIRWLVAAGKMAGLDTSRLLKGIGITPADICNQQKELPYLVAMSFREKVLSTIQNQSIALQVGEQLPLGELGIVDYICASSNSVSSAMKSLSRYFRLMAHPDFGLSYFEQNQAGIIRYGREQQLASQKVPYEQQSTEFTFAITISRLRTVTNRAAKCDLVSFRHPVPEYVNDYQRIFQAPIEFNATENNLILNKDSLTLSLENQDDRLYQLLTKYADSSMSHLPVNPALSHRVVDELKQALQDGEITAQSIAKKLHISPRTLHRRLNEENTCFVKLRDQLRCDLSKTMLMNAELSQTDIAFLLGFSQPSAFNRAFKRWVGCTPQQFRHLSSVRDKSITS